MNSKLKNNILEIINKNRTGYLLIIIIMIINGFVQAASILGIMPIVDYVISNDPENTNRITKFVVSIITKANFPVNIVTMGGFYFIIVIIKSSVSILEKYVTSKVHFKVMKEIIYDEYTSFINASWKFFGRKKYGTLANTIVKETEKATVAFEGIALATAATITSIFYIILASFISWQLVLIILGLTVLVVSPTYLIGKSIYKIREIHTDASNYFQNLVYETLNSIKLIAGFSKRKSTIDKIKPIIEKISHTSVQFTMIRAFSGILGEPLGILLIVVSVSLGLNTLDLGLPGLFVFLYTINKFSGQVQLIINQRNQYKGAEPSLNQIFLLKEEAENNKEVEKGKKINTFEKIKIDNLSFSYDGNKNVINNIDISINKGDMIAIVGESGAGKSTLIDLIMGFYYSSSGSIKIDSSNIKDINLDSWRNIIGYIPQQPFLFNTSIRDNLLWANNFANEKDIIEACELANAMGFIDEMEEKFDTIVGERGLRLSGGQAQRLCLARALIKKPEILILDEATSSLDSQSELLIQKSIEHVSNSSTVISIAHRLSTIKKADCIYQLQSGNIIEKGTFKELINSSNGLFSKSAELQGIS